MNLQVSHYSHLAFLMAMARFGMHKKIWLFTKTSFEYNLVILYTNLRHRSNSVFEMKA